VGIEGGETLTLTGNPSAQWQMASNKLVRKGFYEYVRDRDHEEITETVLPRVKRA